MVNHSMEGYCMSIQNEIKELTNRRANIVQGGSQEDIEAIHASGLLTARERIEVLLDDSTFVEIGAFVQPRSTNFNLLSIQAPADGVVTGYGTIEGRLVYVYSQDSTVLGGALGEMHAKKIVQLYDLALKTGAPIIGLLDSSGLRLQESTDGLAGFGEIFLKQSIASGVIPQFIGVLGTCGGGAAIMPSLADVTVMSLTSGKLFVNSQNTLDKTEEGTPDYTSAIQQAMTTGVVDIVCENDKACLLKLRELIELVPSNNLEESPLIESHDDINRTSETLNQIVVENGMDGRTLVKEIVDHHALIELRETYAPTVVTALGHLSGISVGFIACQTLESDGRLTAQAAEKIADFVKFLDAFNLPIISFVDISGFAATVEQEKLGISKSVAKMVSAFSNATCPKINVIIKRAYGTAYVAFNSKSIGADMVYAWPSAMISMMDAKSAVRIMYAESLELGTLSPEDFNEAVLLYENEQASPYTAASRGYVDDIIEPAATRKRVVAALEMLYTKYTSHPTKKHPVV